MSYARLATMATPAALGSLWAAVDMSVSTTANGWPGLLLRYTDTSNFLAVYVGANSAVCMQRVAGVDTLITWGSFTISGVDQLSQYRLIAIVDSYGAVTAYLQQGSILYLAAQGYSADLATGGTLATGKVGLFDWTTGATACTRTYYGLYVYGASTDYAIPASQSLEIRHDRVIREDAGGTLWQPPSSYKGDYLLVPPAGREGRSVRWIAKASRGPIETGFDSGIDNISARLTYTPRYLVVPEP